LSFCEQQTYFSQIVSKKKPKYIAAEELTRSGLQMVVMQKFQTNNQH
jgi:hypothetical protein